MKHYKVIDEINGHGFTIGEIISATLNTHEYINAEGNIWYLKEEEVEFVFETAKVFDAVKFRATLLNIFDGYCYCRWNVGESVYWKEFGIYKERMEIDVWLFSQGAVDGETVYLEY